MGVCSSIIYISYVFDMYIKFKLPYQNVEQHHLSRIENNVLSYARQLRHDRFSLNWCINVTAIVKELIVCTFKWCKTNVLNWQRVIIKNRNYRLSFQFFCIQSNGTTWNECTRENWNQNQIHYCELRSPLDAMHLNWIQNLLTIRHFKQHFCWFLLINNITFIHFSQNICAFLSSY